LLKPRWVRVSLLLAVTLGILFLSREKVLWALGQMLVHTEAPVRGDAVVVLGGDGSGNRVLKGAQLVNDGWAPVLVISGAGGQYGYRETSLAMNFAADRGFPRDKMVAVPHTALSTADEAVYDVRELRKMGVRRYILVTSFSHTARARQVFQRTAPDLEFVTVGCDERFWAQGRWWTNREGRKIWFFATVKSIADYLDI